ncbi:Hypothetical predicted protein [Pelobates cultripes]|uniref:Uncharacterized protein n=1 Tax=Pelobates cultripes TaxID=61616 RepID=A0AAD1RMF4_PELCU|nr:Hypothetical predicted protein [Pelobates cultripes]
MGKPTKPLGNAKLPNLMSIISSLWRYLWTLVDSEPHPVLPETCHVSSSSTQDSPALILKIDPPPTEKDWMSLIRASMRKDLRKVTTSPQTSILADLQLLRNDLQGVMDRVDRV